MLKIYNTLTRKKEDFKPYKQDFTKVYYCGPTPYNYAHIGNLKAYVGNDMIVRTLKFLGYRAKTTMNITDIDDKTIRDSQFEGKTLLEHTRFYTKAFLEDIDKLGIEKADNIVPISEIIPEMTRMINTLLRRKNAYIADDNSIYFNIKTFKKYGKLANLDMKGMKESVRIDNDEYDKENAADFALWKAWNKSDGDNFWKEEFEIFDSSHSKLKVNCKAREGILGCGSESLKSKNTIYDSETSSEGQKIIIKGRPGWHIECSACAMKYLGPQIDLHMGGIDNLFPHHQNEVAQTECCTRKTFSKYWAHHGHLTVDGRKMSKSKNNFYTLRDLEEKFKDIDKKLLYRAVRLNFLNGKYRDSIDLSFSKLEANFNTLTSIDETLKNLKNYKTKLTGVSKAFREDMQSIIFEYIEKLEDDFNIPEAMAVFFKFQKFVNLNLREGNFSTDEINSVIDVYKTFNQVLAVIDFSILEDSSEEIPTEILEKLEKRNKAKFDKDFTLADKLRDKIKESGFKIIDDRQGSKVEKI